MNQHILTGQVDVTSNLLVGSSHLFVDTTNNRVGLVTNDPHAGLHVNSNAYVDTDLRVGSQIEINETAGRIKAASFEGDGSLLVNAPVGSLAVHSTDTGLPGTDASVTNEGTPTAAEFKFVIPRGDVGATGAAATVAVGTTTTGAAGSDASVTNSGTTSTAVFDFTVPKGDQGIQGIQGIQGETGTAATVTVGTTTTGVPGTNASVTNTGSSSAASFDFTIPRGDTGATGPAGTVAIGTTTTGAAGSSASVTNTGTSTAANLEFTIPKGDQGIQGVQGVQGVQGDTGPAGTVAIGTTTTGAAGSSASVTNTGTSTAANLEFTIPRGAQGVQGPAATVAVGTTTTGAAGTNGSVTNSGSSSAAVFDFTVPRGADGADGTNYFTLSGSDIYRSTGNVGIGTTSPSQKFVVMGDSAIIHSNSADTHNTNDRTLYIGGREVNGSLNQSKCAIVSTPSTSHGGAGQYGRNALHFCVGPDAQNNTNASKTDSRMCIDYTGNVGIGTTSPSHGRMQIVCSSQTPDGGLTIRGGDFNAGLGAMWVQGSGSGQRFNIQAYRNESTNPPAGTNPSIADADAFELCLNPKGGNVGIGTLNPSCTLDVRGSGQYEGIYSKRIWVANIGDNSGVGSPDDNTGSPWRGLGFDNLAWNNQSFRYSADIPILSGYNGVALRSGGGNLVLTEAGNVGIGTTSPSQKLDVVGGPTKSDGFILGTSNNLYTPGCIYTDSNWGMLFRSAVSSPGIADFLFNDYAGNQMMVIDGGNVGIGTTNPGEKLHVDGIIKAQTVNCSGDGPVITCTASNPGDMISKRYGSADRYGMGQYAGGMTRLFTATVYSSAKIALSGATDDVTGSAAAFTDYLTVVASSGNVGIGVTDPNHKLEVSGGILADYIAIPEINLHGAKIGHIIEYRYSGMPSTAPTDESSMNSEFGQRHSISITTNTQMRYPYGTAAENIGRMWIGIIQATSTGVYTFGVNSDDASDLFVAGYRVADWYSGHGHNSSNINIPGGNQRTIYLKGGQWYKVKARFEENGGGEAFFALWKKPGDTSFSEIPSGNLAYILSDYSSAPTSDDRLKVNETMISNATETIIKLKPQIYDKFEFIEDVHDTKNKPTRESGLIAQDIWYDAPELRHMVYPYKTPNETREVNEDIQQDPDYSDWGPVAAQVNYFGLIPYLIKSFQELHGKVTSEKVKTKNLEALVLSLITRVQKLEAR